MRSRITVYNAMLQGHILHNLIHDFDKPLLK